MEERLQKYMASAGIGSRRNCEKIIMEGRVKVNEVLVTELGFKVDTLNDKIFVDGRLIKPEEKMVYIALYKPEGYLCTLKDERGRKTVLDLVVQEERIFPIGRLDYDTSGLILLTNDGDIYNKVIHPRKNINKIYEAVIEGVPEKSEISKFCSGIDIGGYITAPAEFKLLKVKDNTSKVQITIHEGKKRQIRRMCKAIKHPVITLKRISIGSIGLTSLNKGEWRYLSEKEIDYLKNL